MISHYMQLLKLPGATALALPAASARIAVAMAPLALLIAMTATGSSASQAGLVSGLYSTGMAVASPLTGRLAERFGGRLFLLLGGIATTALCAIAFHPGQYLELILGFTAGFATPPVGAAMRSSWQRLTPTGNDVLLQRTFTFEATLTEIYFILAPIIVATLYAVGSPQSTVLATAAFLFAGSVGFGFRFPKVPDASKSHFASIISPRFLIILLLIALTSAISSAEIVAILAYFESSNIYASWIGVVLAIESVAAVVSGVLYGRRHWTGSPLSRYIALMLALTTTAALLPVVQLAETLIVPLTGLILFCIGLTLAPTGSEEFQLVSLVVPPGRTTSAFSLVGAAIGSGSGLGLALGGGVVDWLGVWAGLLLPAALSLASLFVVLLSRKYISLALPK